MEQTYRRRLGGMAKFTQFLLAMGVVGMVVYAGMYLMAMSPLLIRLLGPALASE